MNTFEVAVLRVIVKRRTPLKLSSLVNGFPDDSEDYVLAAISSLKLRGYIMFSDYQPNTYVFIATDRRKEILQIIDSNNCSDKSNVLPAEPVSEEKKGTRMANYLPQIRTVVIGSLIVFGLFAVLVPGMPTSSTDTEFVAHQHNSAFHRYAYGTNNRDNLQSSVTGHPHVSPALVILKDCSQKQQA